MVSVSAEDCLEWQFQIWVVYEVRWIVSLSLAIWSCRKKTHFLAHFLLSGFMSQSSRHREAFRPVYVLCHPGALPSSVKLLLISACRPVLDCSEPASLISDWLISVWPEWSVFVYADDSRLELLGGGGGGDSFHYIMFPCASLSLWLYRPCAVRWGFCSMCALHCGWELGGALTAG